MSTSRYVMRTEKDREHDEATMKSFGRLLGEMRESRGMTTHALAERADVDHGNLYRVERGLRQTMSLRVCFDLVMALPDTTPDERKELLDAAILDRTVDEWYRYLIYEFVATADARDLQSAMRAAQRMLADDDDARGVLHDHTAREMLLMIAESPALAPQRLQIVRVLARAITIQTADTTVEVAR